MPFDANVFDPNVFETDQEGDLPVVALNLAPQLLKVAVVSGPLILLQDKYIIKSVRMNFGMRRYSLELEQVIAASELVVGYLFDERWELELTDNPVLLFDERWNLNVSSDDLALLLFDERWDLTLENPLTSIFDERWES